jgi:uncharacterized protein
LKHTIFDINKRLSHFIAQHPYAIVFTALVVFVISIVLASRIYINPNVRDMLPDSDPYVQAYDELIEQYLSTEIVTIALQANELEDLQLSAELLVQNIHNDSLLAPLIAGIYFKPDSQFVLQWGLLHVPPPLISSLSAHTGIYGGLTHWNARLDSVLSGFLEPSAQSNLATSGLHSVLQKANHSVQTWNDFLQPVQTVNPDSVAHAFVHNALWKNQYVVSQDQTMLLLFITPNFGSLEYDKTKLFMSRLHTQLAQLSSNMPLVQAGVTGNIAMNYDRVLAMSRDMTWPSILALSLIIVLFSLSLKEFRSGMLAIVSLLFGIAFTYGIISFYPGQINIASSMCIIILIGLGIDFGIHIITHYGHHLKETHNAETALHLTLQQSGVGIIMGGVTTSAAFFVLLFSESKGLSDLGFIGGLGIIITMATMLVLLPALLFIAGDKQGSELPSLPKQITGTLDSFITRFRWPVLLGGLCITVLLGWVGTHNYRVMSRHHMEDPNSISTQTLQNVIQKFQSGSDALLLSVPHVEQARLLQDTLSKLPQVARVDGIMSWLPDSSAQHQALQAISTLRSNISATQRQEWLTVLQQHQAEYNTHLSNMGEQPLAHSIQHIVGHDSLLGAEYRFQIQRLAGSLKELKTMLNAEQEALVPQINAIVGTQSAAGSLDTLLEWLALPQRATRLMQLDSATHIVQLSVLQRMAAITQPMQVSHLPQMVQNTYISKDGSHTMLRVYAKGDIWQTQVLDSLVQAMQPVFPHAVGAAMVFRQFNEHVFSEAIQMSGYALLVVMLLLWLNMRSAKQAFITMIPLLFGALWMFGFMEIFKLRYTFTNVITFPMVLGIGIDTGIHMMHSFLHTKSIGRMLQITGKAVILSSITSMIGFGAIGFTASTMGVRNFGQTLFWGVGSCLITSIFVFSALLAVYFKKKSNNPQ